MTSVALRLLVLGLDNSGKSTFVTRLFGDDIEKTRPTVGLVIRTKTHVVEGVVIDVDYWDVGGQESLRRHWHNIYHKGDAVVWIIDSSDVERMDTCVEQLELTAAAVHTKSLGFLIVCNKQDLPTALTLSDIRQRIPKIGDSSILMEACSAVQMSPDELDGVISRFIQTFLTSLPIVETRLALPQSLPSDAHNTESQVDWNLPIQLRDADNKFTILKGPS